MSFYQEHFMDKLRDENVRLREALRLSLDLLAPINKAWGERTMDGASILSVNHTFGSIRQAAEAHRKISDSLSEPSGEPPAPILNEDYWDQHAVQCGNCSVEILTRGGSIPNNNGLSDTGGSEDEALCGKCAGSQMYAYADEIEALRSKDAR
jgi:hypothetical protein